MAERVNKKTKARRPKQLHQWHWISSALCLISMVLFSVTGITLNHAADIDAQPVISDREAVLPPPLLETLAQTESGPLPKASPPVSSVLGGRGRFQRLGDLGG